MSDVTCKTFSSRVFVRPAGLTEAAIEALAERFTVKSAPVTPADDVEEWPDLGAPSNAGRGAQAGQQSSALFSMSSRHFMCLVVSMATDSLVSGSVI